MLFCPGIGLGVVFVCAYLCVCVCVLACVRACVFVRVAYYLLW